MRGYRRSKSGKKCKLFLVLVEIPYFIVLKTFSYARTWPYAFGRLGKSLLFLLKITYFLLAEFYYCSRARSNTFFQIVLEVEC